MRGRLGQHKSNFAGRLRLCGADSVCNSFVILLGKAHHQLPEAPPPPDDPPPPENPPPPEKPPPPENPPPRDPPEVTRILKSVLKNNQRKVRETMSIVMRPNSATSSSQLPGSVLCSVSSRSDGRSCHSEASVVRTVIMSSTPREMPPLKSPLLKRGVMALTIITFDSASVSVFSRP